MTAIPVPGSPAYRLPTFLRLALRELRGGLAGFYVFIACIALGVGAIAGVNSVAQALIDGISAEGRVILGGDLAFSLVQREATPAELGKLRSYGEVGTIATMRGMARRMDGNDQALVELKAADATYPHGGVLTLEGGGDPQALMARKDGLFGALAASELLDRLGLAVGDTIKLGSETWQIRGVINSEPDALSSGLGFGPRLIVPVEGLRTSGLLQPGSLVTWTYRLGLPADTKGAELRRTEKDINAALPDAGWNVRSRTNASPSLSRNIEHFGQFLTLVGLNALIVGGVGVANAVSSFVDLKRPAIATLKCLGASGTLIFRIYLAQILILAGVGIVIGLLIGAALPFVAAAVLQGLLPVSEASRLFPAQLLLAVVYGVLVTLAFSLWPLGRARQMPAASLFADRAIGSPVQPPRSYRLAQVLALAVLAAMAIGLSGDHRLALTYIGGLIAAFVVLRLVALGIMKLAARAGTIRGTALRLAIRNIHRPGALTPSVVLSLGVGLTLLVNLALIDTNLRNQLTHAVVNKAPDFFFIDIQPSERQGFVDLLTRTAPGAKIDQVPMLRGRITGVNGVAAEQVKPGEGGSWALRGDRGITYSDTLPQNSSLVTGAWWPAGYSGEPEVSVEDEIAKALNVKVGDTLTVNVLGRNITARIASTRALDWESMSINFVMVFSPNTFAGAPASILATLRMPPGAGAADEKALMRAATQTFPTVTSVRVKDAIDSVNALIGDLALGVEAAASIALLASVLVLGGSLAAGHRQRRQDAVILKVLGATRRDLLAAFSLEYGLLGLATAVFAIAAGAVGAWYVLRVIMDVPFTFFPGIAVAAVAVALAVTLGLGLAGTWRVLSVRPAPMLRNL